jgi:hypothetical protein
VSYPIRGSGSEVFEDETDLESFAPFDRDRTRRRRCGSLAIAVLRLRHLFTVLHEDDNEDKDLRQAAPRLRSRRCASRSSVLRTELCTGICADLRAQLCTGPYSDLRAVLRTELCSVLRTELCSVLRTELCSVLRTELCAGLCAELRTGLCAHSAASCTFDGATHASKRTFNLTSGPVKHLGARTDGLENYDRMMD